MSSLHLKMSLSKISLSEHPTLFANSFVANFAANCSATKGYLLPVINKIICMSIAFNDPQIRFRLKWVRLRSTWLSINTYSRTQCTHYKVFIANLNYFCGIGIREYFKTCQSGFTELKTNSELKLKNIVDFMGKPIIYTGNRETHSFVRQILMEKE